MADEDKKSKAVEEPEITQPEQPAAQEKKPETDFSSLLPDSMEEVLTIIILQLREWGYIHMGYIPHPKKKIVVKDMHSAKMAIDSAVAVFEVLKANLEAGKKQELEILINDMKMNFVSKSAEKE